jgi:hypothetical protein
MPFGGSGELTLRKIWERPFFLNARFNLQVLQWHRGWLNFAPASEVLNHPTVTSRKGGKISAWR